MRKALIVAVALLIGSASFVVADSDVKTEQTDVIAARGSNPIIRFFQGLWDLEQRKNAWLRRVFGLG